MRIIKKFISVKILSVLLIFTSLGFSQETMMKRTKQFFNVDVYKFLRESITDIKAAVKKDMALNPKSKFKQRTLDSMEKMRTFAKTIEKKTKSKE